VAKYRAVLHQAVAQKYLLACHNVSICAFDDFRNGGSSL
jgi:hypothetical protein